MNAWPTSARALGALVRLEVSIARFVRAEQGATMSEYAILVGFVAVVALAGAKAFGVSVAAKFVNDAARVANP